jgi:polar amino acid transport system permease protein
VDISFMLKYLPTYGHAALLTLRIGAIGIVLSLLVGLLCSLLWYLKVPVLRQIASVYVEISRNTPLLVQLFLLYFGLPKIGIMLSGEACAILGLTFLGGSYMAEAIRSGLEAVDKIQMESALSLGLTKGKALVYVLVPQMMALSVPPLCANAVFLIKETSVFSVVALADLMYVAKELIGLYYNTNEALLLLVVFYLLILLPLTIAASLLERRLRYAGFGDSV